MGVVIAIDGPAGAGKSSVARTVATRLGFGRVDTGAMYRAITLAVMEAELEEAEAIGALARELPVRLEGSQTLIGERDVSAEIRSDAVTSRVSAVSALAPVREALLIQQRRLGRAHPKGVVLEGRDIGTVVFPDAELKVFLTASDEERARRRHRELGADAPELNEVLEALRRRDALDGTRDIAPLIAAPDAVEVDTTGLSFDEVVDRIVALADERTSPST